MAISAKVGAISTGTGIVGTTIEETIGFQAKAIVFWWSGATGTTDATGSNSISAGLGFACSTTDRRCTGWGSTDAGATSATGRIQRNDACVALVNGSGSVVGLLDVSAIGATSFTLAVDDAFPSSYRIHYLALGGTTLTNAVTGEFDGPDDDATGNQSVTGVGFQPDGVLFSGGLFSSSSQATIAFWGMGAAVSNTQQAAASVGSRTGQTAADTASYCLEGPECIALCDTNTANLPPVMRAEYTQSTADGFDLNWLEVGFTGTRLFYYLALKGVSMKIGSLLTQTDTSTTVSSGSLGFEPKAAIFVSAARAESAQNVATPHAHISIGAATGPTERGAQAAWDEDGALDMECATALEHDAVYANISDADTLQGLMDVQAFGADSFTCVMDQADPSQNFVWWMAFGEAAVAGTGSRAPARRMRMGVGR